MVICLSFCLYLDFIQLEPTPKDGRFYMRADTNADRPRTIRGTGVVVCVMRENPVQLVDNGECNYYPNRLTLEVARGSQ